MALVASDPDHPPEAVQLVALVDDQVNVEDAPETIEVGFAEIETVGAAGVVLNPGSKNSCVVTAAGASVTNAAPKYVPDAASSPPPVLVKMEYVPLEFDTICHCCCGVFA